MKLIIAVVQDQDQNVLSSAFFEANIRATKLSSTGGFLRSGNTTFIIGIEEDRVDEVLNIIQNSCQAREQFVSSTMNIDVSFDVATSYPVKVEVGGATVFVLPIDQFIQF